MELININEHNKKSFSPYIAIIGDDLLKSKKFLIVYDPNDVKNVYEFDDILIAVECCFRITHAFQIPFGHLTKHVWLFLQFYVFTFAVEKIGPTGTVVNLANELKLASPLSATTENL